MHTTVLSDENPSFYYVPSPGRDDFLMEVRRTDDGATATPMRISDLAKKGKPSGLNLKHLIAAGIAIYCLVLVAPFVVYLAS